MSELERYRGITCMQESERFGMKMGQRWLLGAILSVLLAGNAQAHDWTGPYVGVHAGYGTGTTDWLLVQNAGNNPSGQIGDIVTSNDPAGLLGGVQVGYNKQYGRFVAGVEGELSFGFGELDGYSTWTNEDGRFRDATATIDSLMTLAARGGVHFNKNEGLAFVKFGAAVANGSYSHTGGSPANPRVLRGTESQLGIVAGAGVEHTINRRATVKFEYNFVHIPRSDVSLTDGERTAIFGISHDLHVFKVGLNIQLGQP